MYAQLPPAISRPVSHASTSVALCASLACIKSSRAVPISTGSFSRCVMNACKVEIRFSAVFKWSHTCLTSAMLALLRHRCAHDERVKLADGLELPAPCRWTWCPEEHKRGQQRRETSASSASSIPSSTSTPSSQHPALTMFAFISTAVLLATGCIYTAGERSHTANEVRH